MLRLTAPVLGLFLAAAGTLPSLPPPSGASIESPAPVHVVRLPFPAEDGSLTPYTFTLGYSLMNLVYDTLLWRDADGVPRPWLARSVEASADGMTVTLRLVEGVRWQDGAALTADDVAFTFAYMASHPQPRFTPELEAVRQASARGPATVVISLTHPTLGFIDQPLADMPILPAHLWRNLAPGRAAPDGLPVGSGPYRLVEHQSGHSYRFEANPGYFRGEPAVAEIDVPVISDIGAVVARFRQGSLDMLPFALPRDLAGQIPSLGVGTLRGPSYLGTALVFDVRRQPFDRVEVRQALAQAIDIDGLSSVVGNATAADRGLLHPDSEWAAPDGLGRFDQAAAQGAIARLKLPPIDVLAPDNDPSKIEASHQVAVAWSRLGVAVTSKVVAESELSTALGDDGSTPTFEAAIVSTSPRLSYDPDLLRLYFGPPVTTGGLNESGYASKDLDVILNRIATSNQAAARHLLVDDALRLLARDVPVLPLFFTTGAYVYRPSVWDGWVFIKGTGILDKRSFLQAPAPAPSPGGVEPGPLVRHVGGVPGWLLPAGLAAGGSVVTAAVVRSRLRRR